jgi:hypothetical protein
VKARKGMAWPPNQQGRSLADQGSGFGDQKPAYS